MKNIFLKLMFNILKSYINFKIEKVESLIANLQDKNECIVHIKSLK